jgi:Ca-activated chloride channel homolog
MIVFARGTLKLFGLVLCIGGLTACGSLAEDEKSGISWERSSTAQSLAQPDEELIAEPIELTAEQVKQREDFIRAAHESVPDQADRSKGLSPYFFVFSKDASVDRLPLKSTSVRVDIAGVVARVQIEQVYENKGRNPLEAIYIFPASARAAVSAMRMTIGRRTIEAKIEKRQKARQEYEQARSRGQTAALLEQQRPNVFQMNVANILPGDSIKVEVDYSELLIPEDNVYEFVYPGVVGPRYSNVKADQVAASESWVKNPYMPQGEVAGYSFDMDVQLRSGIPIAKLSSPSHEIEAEFPSPKSARLGFGKDTQGSDRDFVLHYTLAGDQIESGLLLYPGQEENFFLLMMEPPERVEPRAIVPREYIFIMDVSGSMRGFPIKTSKQLMRSLLGDLGRGDYFNLLLFAGGNSVLSKKSLGASQANIKRALNLIDHQRGGGGTEILPALERALNLPRIDGVARIIVIATDGYVRVEKETFELIRARLGDANLFTFGIGSSVNRFLIEGMARAGLGEPFVVMKRAEAKAKAEKFRQYVSSPIMQDITVDFEGFDVYDVEPQAMPDLFARRPLCLFGKYRGEAQGLVVVKGQVPGEQLHGRLDVAEADRSKDNSALRLLWARQRISWLGDLNKLESDDVRIEQISDLGLKYKLMTDYTSFVAIDSAVRSQGRNLKTVKQPLPLPLNVTNQAVGSRGVLGVLGRGSGGGGAGMMGGLGNLGTTGRGGAAANVISNTAAVRVKNGDRFKVSGLVSGGTGSPHGKGVGFNIVQNAKGKGLLAGAKPAGKVHFKSPQKKIKVAGKLSREAIQKVINKHIRQIQYCYEKELTLKHDLSGKFVLQFTIGVNGKVSRVKIKSSTMNSKGVEKCVARYVKKWVFPKPKGGSVTVTYPFNVHLIGF